MLCCGLLAVIAAAAAGSWRRLGAARWIVTTVTAMLAIPAVATAMGDRDGPLSRAEIGARTLLCGEPAE